MANAMPVAVHVGGQIIVRCLTHMKADQTDMPPKRLAITIDYCSGQKLVLSAAQGLQLCQRLGWGFRFCEDLLIKRKDLIATNDKRFGMFGRDTLCFHFCKGVGDIAGRGLFGLQRGAKRVFIDPRDMDVEGDTRVTQQLCTNVRAGGEDDLV